MKDKFLKIISYLFEIPISRYYSETNGWVAISLDRGEYKLSASDAIYSFGRKYTSFKTTFDTIDWSQETINDVLILGYGLGSITTLLSDRITHAISITGVDIDQFALNFSQKITQHKNMESIELFNQDAEYFLNDTENEFDLICFDIFVNDKTPTQFSTEKFLIKLLTCGRKNCLYFFSRLNLDQEDKYQNRLFEDLLEKLNIQYSICDTGGNNVYVWRQAN